MKVKIHHKEVPKESSRSVSAPFNQTAVEWGTSVSSVTWNVEKGSAAISNESLSSNDASALVTCNQVGCVLIRVKALMANGESSSKFLELSVIDPASRCRSGSTDYV